MEKPAVLKEIIESRRSIFPKDYTTEDIEPEILEEILNSANFAPNHKRTKPWRLKVFKGEEKNNLGQHLADIYKNTTAPEVFLEKKHLSFIEKVEKANVIISISVNFSGLLPEWEEIAATAMAVQNMYLTSTANKVGCYWSSPGMIKHLDEFARVRGKPKMLRIILFG